MASSETPGSKERASALVAVAGIIAAAAAVLAVWASLAAADKAPCPAVLGLCQSPGEEQEDFLASYFKDLAAGDYESAWQKLGPGFQSRNSESFESYRNFWASVRSVQLVTVNSLAAGRTDKRVRALWRISYHDAGTESETIPSVFTLIVSPDGKLLIEGACDERNEICDTLQG